MKRSILGLMYLIQGMRQVGIDVDARLQQIGIQADALDPSSSIHSSLEWDILNVMSEGVVAETGVCVGQHYALAGYGPLLMLLVTCPTVEQALNKGIQYQQLTHLSGVLSLVQQEQQVALHYQPVDLASEMGAFRAQCEIAGTYKFIQDLYRMMGLSSLDIRVQLPFAKPLDAEKLQMYQTYYGNQVYFNAPCAIFSFLDCTVLNVKIPSNDPITFHVYELKCLAELARLNAEEQDQSVLVQRVKNYLALQQGMMPSMQETAYALGIPERTLRHQLQQRKTSYKQIREQLIKDKALHLIEYKEYSIEMISELLGYSEPAAFNHAFKRWFGRSPRQYGK